MTAPQERLKMAHFILEFEARRDRLGRLSVYKLPPGDGGGTFEVAGINNRYHPEEARQLAGLIGAGCHEEAEQKAGEFIASYTDAVTGWTSVPAVECYLRDCVFNRGPAGAARILQRALGVADDGIVGSITRKALAARETDAAALLAALRAAREQYERDVARRDESSRFWKGLVNRWNKARDAALTFGCAPAGPRAPGAGILNATPGCVQINLTPPSTVSLTAPAAAPLPPTPLPALLRALRKGSEGDLVCVWQTFLLGQGFDPQGQDGKFGARTAAATRAFQRKHGLATDGVAGRHTLLAAMQLGFELIEEPAPGNSGSDFPPYPGFPPLTSTAARQALFGAFEYRAEPRPGNREHIRILGGWTQDSIVTVTIPQLRTALGPQAPAGMPFHRKGAAQLQALWAAWEENGLLARVQSFDGAFVPRFVRGSTSVLSNHAFGSAFDINAGQNPLGVRPPLTGERGSVRELAAIAESLGFFWGGHFGRRPDGMHFEIAALR